MEKDKEAIEMISNQTGMNDTERIQEVLQNNNGDIVKTIMLLSGIQECPDRNVTKPSEFDEIRKIVNEKEEIFFKRKTI